MTIVYVLTVWWAANSTSAVPEVFTHRLDCEAKLESIVAHAHDKPAVADCYMTVVQRGR